MAKPKGGREVAARLERASLRAAVDHRGSGGGVVGGRMKAAAMKMMLLQWRWSASRKERRRCI
jgi:hypothetical protein